MAKAKNKPKIVAASNRDASARRETKSTACSVVREKKALRRNWNDVFGQVSCVIAHWMGKPIAFLIASTLVIVRVGTGPLFKYSDTWQLVINTTTTIITFLMVFLIQNTQNRDARAINLKLNELIFSIASARNQMVDIEHLSDAELDVLSAHYERLHNEAVKRGLREPEDTPAPR